MAETFYQILGVDPTANDQEIKAAYRKQAIRWHPVRIPTIATGDSD